jgi:hypothetical protein
MDSTRTGIGEEFAGRLANSSNPMTELNSIAASHAQPTKALSFGSDSVTGLNPEAMFRTDLDVLLLAFRGRRMKHRQQVDLTASFM